jgi:CHAD domain-containing protein
VLIRHLDAFRQQVAGVRQARDPEPLHQMRVATRRLRATLPLFAPVLAPKKSEEWLRAVRKITRALGPARDLDVQIEQLDAYLRDLPLELRPGIRRLHLRLAQSRQSLQPSILIALDSLASSGVLEKIEEKTLRAAALASPDQPSPALAALARSTLLARLDDLLAFEPYITQPEQVEPLHRMRIAAKWLRYTLETFAPLDPAGLKPYLRAAKDTQEMLGIIHDCDTWAAYLPAFLQAEQQAVQSYFGHGRPFKRLQAGLVAWAADRQALRERTYAEFISAWQAWQSSRLWDNLRRAFEPAVPVQPPEPPGAA